MVYQTVDVWSKQGSVAAGHDHVRHAPKAVAIDNKGVVNDSRCESFCLHYGCFQVQFGATEFNWQGDLPRIGVQLRVLLGNWCPTEI